MSYFSSSIHSGNYTCKQINHVSFDLLVKFIFHAINMKSIKSKVAPFFFVFSKQKYFVQFLVLVHDALASGLTLLCLCAPKRRGRRERGELHVLGKLAAMTGSLLNIEMKNHKMPM